MVFSLKITSHLQVSTTQLNGADLLPQLPNCTDTEDLADPLTHFWVRPIWRGTFISIKTVYTSGAFRINPHQSIIKNQRRGGGYPALNNAHQLGSTCGGERVNKSRAVGGFGGVAMTKKHSSSYVESGECLVAVRASFKNDTNQLRLNLPFNAPNLLNLQ